MLLSFSFTNILYIVLLAITTTAEMEMLQLLEIYPHILFMLFDSIGLFSFILVEDIVLFISPKKRSLPSLKKVMFHKRSFKYMRSKKKARQRKRKFLISICLLSLLTAIVNGLKYCIFLFLVSGLSPAFCVCSNLITWLILFFVSKLKMYRHHIVALIILIISLVTSLITNSKLLPLIWLEFHDIWLVCLPFIMIVIALPLREILEKYTLELFYFDYTRLFFYEGSGSLFITLLIMGLIQLIDCRLINQIKLKQFCINTQINSLFKKFINLFSFKSLDTLFIWLYFFASMSTNCFRVWINRKDGPSHRYSGDLLAFALFMVISITESSEVLTRLFNWGMISILGLLIIGCLIYNENLRVNICQLSSYTKYEIQKRADRLSERDQEQLLSNLDDEIEIANIINKSPDNK